MFKRIVLILIICVACSRCLGPDYTDREKHCYFHLDTFNHVDVDESLQVYNSTHHQSLHRLGKIAGNNIQNGSIQGEFITDGEVNMLGSIAATSIYAGKNVDCLLLEGRTVENNNLKAKSIIKTYLKATDGVKANVIQGKNLNEIHFIGDYSSEITKNNLTGNFIDGVYMEGDTITDNDVEADVLKEIYINGVHINNTSIKADSVHDFNGLARGEGEIDRTNISATTIYGIALSALEISGSRISGSTLIKWIFLFGTYSLVGNNIEATGVMSNVAIKANIVRDLNITSMALELVYVDGTEKIRNVRIKASWLVKDVYINGIRADEVVDSSQPSPAMRDFDMLCDDTNGYPENAEMQRECLSPFCQSTCVSKGYKKGKCCGRTCCCINDKAFPETITTS